MIKNLSIKKKLILAFIFIGLFSTIVGAYGMTAIGNMNENTKNTYSKHFVPVTYLSNVQENLHLINTNYILMLYEKDMLQSKKRMKEITGWKKENDELLQQYKKISVSEGSRTLYSKLERDLDSYYSVMTRLGQLLLSNDYRNAMNLAPEFHSKSNIVKKDIQQLILSDVQAANKYLHNSQQTFHLSIILMIAFSLLCLFFAFASGSLISKKLCKPIIELASAADKLAVGEIDFNVKTDLKDEVGDLVAAFGKMADNIKNQAEAAKKIASGDVSVEIIPGSQSDILGTSMMSVVKTLRNLLEEVNAMISAALGGRLDYRGDSERFDGGYREIIEGFNQTLEAVVIPINLSADYLKKISKGLVPDRIEEEFKGDFNEIKDSLNNCIDSIKALIEDTGTLSDAAIHGRLSTRADVSRHGGDFAVIIEGINQTLDSVIKPLHTAADYIDKIGRGVIPKEITEDYQGDFNEIKNSINACIGGLNALVEGNEILGRMSQNDYTGRCKEMHYGIFHEISKSINMVSDHVNDIIGMLNRVAGGNLEDLELLRLCGPKSEEDELIPSVTLMMESIKSLIEETNSMTDSAVAGDLKHRGDAGQFQGEYQKVIEGVNRTLDAVIQPIEDASSVLKEVSKGNLHILMNGNYQGDHAEIKDALNMTIRKLQRYIGEISSALAEIGNGRLDFEIKEDYTGDFIEIRESLLNIMLNMSWIMRDINYAADQVASGSRQVSNGSSILSHGSIAQAGSIHELSNSMNEISEHIKQNAIHANRAKELADSTRKYAVKGNLHMKNMVDSMTKINQSSKNISKIIKSIDGIAFQTNLLALNAEVEAARAGQHGKGFAVVAEAVRKLANKSTLAAKETSDLIEGSIRSIQEGTNIVQETASALDDIGMSIEQAAGLVERIAEASNMQASEIAIIHKGIKQVSHVVQNNTATAEESAAVAEQLSGQAEILNDMVSRFQLSQPLNTQDCLLCS